MRTENHQELRRAAKEAYEALIYAALHLTLRDDMNAALHCEDKRHSPLTVKVIAAKDQLQDALGLLG